VQPANGGLMFGIARLQSRRLGESEHHAERRAAGRRCREHRQNAPKVTSTSK